MTASGFHSLLDREFVGLLWFPMAAVTAFIGMLRLQSAQGMKPRRVKSGTLLNRTFHLARRVGVRIDRVFVIPAGRGQLTNAFSVRGGVGLTDNFGEYLSGVELDSVIAHELGHPQGRHTQKKFLTVALVVVFFSLVSIGIPPANPALRALCSFGALSVLLLSYYYVSRRFEYECDRKAVEYTNSPEALIRGLAALYEKTGAPIDCARVVELFMTHPPLIHRVEAVAQRANMSRAQLLRLLPQRVDAKPETTAAVP
jgi:Zn-dependent protease with chaperone function